MTSVRASQPQHSSRAHSHAPSRARFLVWFSVLLLVAFASFIAGICLGPTSVSAPDTMSILGHHLSQILPGSTHSTDPAATTSWPQDPQKDSIVWQLRTPRVILAAIVGAALALAGMVLQAVVRNLLADPYILGIHSGASCGAAAAIVLGIGAQFGDYALQGSAFLGALAATAVVFGVALSSGKLTSLRVLLTGVAIGYALSAATSFLIFASDSPEASRSIMFWLLGSLGLANFNGVLLVTLITTAVVAVAFILLAPRIDALSSGDATSLAVGINPATLRAVLLGLSSLLIGVVVAMSGAIGFIGLIIPHIARRLVGSKHRWALPISAVLGAILLIWADILSRVVLAPQEIPVGIVTALLGAPFIIPLIKRAYPASSN